MVDGPPKIQMHLSGPKVRAVLKNKVLKFQATAPAQTLQASVKTLNVKIHDSTIIKRLNKYSTSCVEGFPGENPLISEKNMTAQFTKLHPNKPQNFWNNVLCTDQTTVELFGH